MNQQLILLVVVMGALFYLLIYRPQSRAKRQREELDRSLAVGSQVVTIGGMHGIVHAISPETVTLKLSEGVFVPFNKSAIATTSSKPGKPIKDDKTGEKSGDSKEEKV